MEGDEGEGDGGHLGKEDKMEESGLTLYKVAVRKPSLGNFYVLASSINKACLMVRRYLDNRYLINNNDYGFEADRQVVRVEIIAPLKGDSLDVEKVLLI